MTFNAQVVEMALMPRPVRFFPSVASTNKEAADWLRDGAPDGAAVVADEQTAGKGRHGRTWHTPPGVAVAVSVVLRVPPEHLPALNMAATLAVATSLRILQLSDVSIKWANDVLVGGKKISGVLPEPIWDGDTLQGVVLGMGVNVRNDFGGTPLADTATTIAAHKQKDEVDRAALLAVLLFELDKRLPELGTAALVDEYRENMPMLGHPVTVATGDGELSGVAADVTEQGALLINRGDEQHTVYAGDVTVVSWERD